MRINPISNNIYKNNNVNFRGSFEIPKLSEEDLLISCEDSFSKTPEQPDIKAIIIPDFTKAPKLPQLSEDDLLISHEDSPEKMPIASLDELKSNMKKTNLIGYCE